MPALDNNSERTIVITEKLFTVDEIKDALAGHSGADWYLAVVSLIQSYRETALDNGAVAIGADNKSAMIGALAAHETLTDLMASLDGLVNAAPQP